MSLDPAILAEPGRLALRPPNLLLVGFSGAGKSAVGRAVASRLGLPFVDLDQAIVARSGRPIPEIFREAGETAFRRLEAETLAAELAQGGRVIALGGGAWIQPRVRQLLGPADAAVWLDVPFEEAWRRIKNQRGRPLVDGLGREGLEGLYAERRAAYALADHRLDVAGRPVEAVAGELARWWERRPQALVRPDPHGPGYGVHLRPKLLEEAGEHLAAAGLEGPVLVVSQEPLRGYASRLEAALAARGFRTGWHWMENGEEAKTPEAARAIWAAALEAGLDRRGTVIAFGGGVVGDTAGFAAATFLRGVRWAAIPSTLLGQVDAAVGGKVGVNLPQGKNLVGAFHHPRVVLADPELLATLPRRELAAGMAEVVKALLLAGPDPVLELEPRLHGGLAAWEPFIAAAIRLKAATVSRDPQEEGLRAILNLGHTVGHALEVITGYRRYLHGEAVAVGLVTALILSERVAGLDPEWTRRVVRLLQGLGLPADAPELHDPALLPKLAQALRRDKKARQGRARFVLLEAPGRPRVGVEVDPRLLAEVFERQAGMGAASSGRRCQAPRQRTVTDGARL